jgi:uncharacterized protein (TIGR02646 family)
MIKITKGPKPDILNKKAAQWTVNVQAAIKAGEELSNSLKSKYNHAEVKAAIVAETHGKCAYCESKMRHVAPGDIEHVVPKSVDPKLWFDWSNLTLACANCNTNKGNREGFIDPHIDEPTDHFWFLGTVLFSKAESDRGMLTEAVLKLNRPELYDKRYDRLQSLERLLRLASKIDDPVLKQTLQQDFIENETKTECEYTAMSRAFVANAQAQGLLPQGQ